MSRILVLLYGVVCYVVFFVTFCYAIGFVENCHAIWSVGDVPILPKTIDHGGPDAPPGTALLINVILLGVFGLQHSIMARRGFKRWWTRFIPDPIERSTYVLIASLILALVFWQWRPMTGSIWTIEQPAARGVLYAISGLGWVTVLWATLLINHFDLFGLRQTWLHFKGREYTPVKLAKPFLYRFVRHPLMLGFIIAFWFTPDMTTGHLLFAAVTTAYIIVAIHIEERDLVDHFGEGYVQYQREVSMIIPFPKPATTESDTSSESGAANA